MFFVEDTEIVGIFVGSILREIASFAVIPNAYGTACSEPLGTIYPSQ
jgi:hypothetical protein